MFSLHWWNILYFIWKFVTVSFNFIHKIQNDHNVFVLMWIKAEPAVEFYAEYYLFSSIDDGDCPNFLKILITSAKYFDSAWVIIRWHWYDVCNENDLDVCEICVMFVRDSGEGV